MISAEHNVKRMGVSQRRNKERIGDINKLIFGTHMIIYIIPNIYYDFGELNQKLIKNGEIQGNFYNYITHLKII